MQPSPQDIPPEWCFEAASGQTANQAFASELLDSDWAACFGSEGMMPLNASTPQGFADDDDACAAAAGTSAGEGPPSKRSKAEGNVAAKRKACREKERREKINERFAELARLLEPDASRAPKSDKALILEDAIKTLQQLRLQINQQQQWNKVLQENMEQQKQLLYQQSLLVPQHLGARQYLAAPHLGAAGAGPSVLQHPVPSVPPSLDAAQHTAQPLMHSSQLMLGAGSSGFGVGAGGVGGVQAPYNPLQHNQQYHSAAAAQQSSFGPGGTALVHGGSGMPSQSMTPQNMTQQLPAASELALPDASARRGDDASTLQSQQHGLAATHTMQYHNDPAMAGTMAGNGVSMAGNGVSVAGSGVPDGKPMSPGPGDAGTPQQQPHHAGGTTTPAVGGCGQGQPAAAVAAGTGMLQQQMQYGMGGVGLAGLVPHTKDMGASIGELGAAGVQNPGLGGPVMSWMQHQRLILDQQHDSLLRPPAA